LQIFRGKSVMVTGHTGFKGSWLIAWLKMLGAQVTGIALDPPTNPSHFLVAQLGNDVLDLRIDLHEKKAVHQAIEDVHPDFLFHLAAQPLVRKSYLDPITTYSTNVIGTLYVLEALRDFKYPCVAVMITSDKCYDNVEWVWGYRETDRLGGPDPYSASKGAAELVIRSHVSSFFPKDGNIRIGIGRAGNVIGGGDWAEDRIVPDCIRAWSKGEEATLRNTKATRPWQHVLEPLSGYLNLAMKLSQDSNLHGEPFNFGPPAHQNHTVLKLVKAMSEYWDQVRWVDVSDNAEQHHESGLLKLNCDKALHQLDWRAVLSFQETVRMTAEWYRSYYENPSKIRDITFSQIKEYETFAQNKGM